MPKPLISVITPSLNRAGMIRRAIDSVKAQNYSAVEHLIIDGGSTDGTLDIIAEYPEIRLYVSADKNLYDAINKGLALAKGAVICLLNSDDWFVPNIFESVMASFATHPDVEMVSGGAEVFQLGSHQTEERLIARHNAVAMKEMRERDIVSGIPLINARFFRRSLYERVGGYDIRFPIGADRDFLMRVHLAGCRNHILPGVLYCYGSHGDSLSFSGPPARLRLAEEYLAISEAHLGMEGPSAERSAYRRWRAWSTGYLVLTRLRIGQARQARALAFRKLSEDPLWPLSFAVQAFHHWRERAWRR